MERETQRAAEQKRVGIWIRVSTEDQAQGESPEHHEMRARAYADAKGWKVIELYDLSGVSGKSVMEHREAKRMLSHVKEGHISGLIFSKLARLARNTRELLDFSDIFQEHEAHLISLGEAIDTSSPAGRLFYTMLAAMATWEREEIAQRVAVSVPIRAKLGKSLGGQAVFGYQWRDHKLVPHPEEAPVRKLIYELFLEHKRQQTVARILNDQGYRTRRGAQFSKTTVERLLRDPTAKGLRRANYTKSTGQKRKWELKPKSDWIYVEVEPIVSADLWDQCNAILDEQRKRFKRAPRKTMHLFSGVTYCACGTKMYVPSNTPKYVCRSCRNKVPIVDLEGIYHEQLKHLFVSPTEIARYREQADEAMQEKEKLLEVLKGEQGKLRREMDKLYDLYMSEKITKQRFGEKYQPLSERLEQVEDQIPVLQAELDVMRIHYLSSDQIIADAKDLYSHWQNLPTEEKRHIVEAITERIEVGKEEISINLCYMPAVTTEGAQPHRAENESSQPHGIENKEVSNPYRDESSGKSRTQPQGFMAATSWKRAG